MLHCKTDKDCHIPVLLKSENRYILVQPEYVDNIGPESFLSTNWQSSAQRIDGTGRGSAWFLERETNDWTLRHYQRGGLIVYLNNETHWYVGQKAVRSFSEFHLLNSMYNQGLPVPRPIAASYYRVMGLWYRAQIIMEKIPSARPFSELLLSGPDELWTNVGKLIRRFHDHGICHADLNCHNILVSDTGLYLIDFDKSAVKQGGSWKQRNLKRLRRSIDKQIGNDNQELIDRRWQRLMEGVNTTVNQTRSHV